MTDATITINLDGTGTVLLEGITTDVQGTTAADARRQAINHVTQRAAALGRPISATAHESGRVYPVLVDTDGTVSQLTRNDGAASAATLAQEPGPAPIVTEVPVAQADTAIDPGATRPGVITHNNEDLNGPSTSQPTPASDPVKFDPPMASTASPETAITGGPGTTAPTPPPAAPLDEAANVPQIPELPELFDDGGYEVTAVRSTTHAALVTDPRWVTLSQQPAEQGIRGAFNGMGLKIAPAEQELEQRREALLQEVAREEEERVAEEERARTRAAQEGRRAARDREQAERVKAERAVIQTNFGEPKTASLMNDKGGVGKTTDNLCIADAFGRIRGGDVVTWDANETRGTMGFRAQKDNHRRNVVDFLNEAATDFTTVEGSKRSTLTRYTRQQGDSKFSVLASHESRESQDQVDADAFRTVHEILSRFYSLILVDTGNNHTADHFQAALAATDQLVIPVSPGEDGAYAAELMLDNFIGQGYGHLVKNAIVLLHDSATRHGDAREIAAKFENRVRTILPIPFDPILDSGGEIDFDTLQPATRTAYQTAAAAIAQGLADTDRQAS